MPILRRSASPSSVYRENNSSANTTLSWNLSGLPSGATITNVRIQMHLEISRSTSNYARVQNPNNNGIEYLRERNSGTYTTSSVFSLGASRVTLTFRADTGVACTFSNFVAIIEYIEPPAPSYSASTVSATDAVAGGNTTITISNPSSVSLLHNISIHLGSGDSGIINLGAGVYSYTYTIPVSWLNYMTNSSTGTGVVYCDTYDGTYLVGSSSTTFTISAPASAGPSVTLSAAPYGSTVPASWGVYVQSLSGVTLTANPSTQYGATITTRAFSAGTQDSSNPNIARVTSLTTAGNNTFSVTVTDSRGFQASASQTINVLPYSSPSLNSISVVRCDSAGNTTNASGTPLETGTYVLASANATFSSCNNHNNITITLEVELNNAWTNVATLTNGVEQVCSAPSSLSGGFDPATVYKFRVRVVDTLGQSTSQIAYLQSIMMVMHVRDDDKGIAFGMVSNRQGFEFRSDWDVYMYQKRIIDLIHPVGSVYLSLDSTDPGQLFPGTQWEFLPGRFLLGAGAPNDNSNVFWGTDLTYDGTNKYAEGAGTTGGESRHTLSVNEMPEHSHYAKTKTYEGNDGWTFAMLKGIPNYVGVWSTRLDPTNAEHFIFGSYAANGHGIQEMDLMPWIGAMGNGYSHNNLPPYLAVYMWKRIA